MRKDSENIPLTVSEYPIVKIPAGQLRGMVESDTGACAFLGIRYAHAGRFEKPRPVSPWQGIKYAQVYGPITMAPEQTNVSGDEFMWPHRYYIQSEDCHYLNIWTGPGNCGNANAKKPVMVFIHGGQFVNGSAIEAMAYEGGNLAIYGDVVVVTVNHRLNVLGYLDLSVFGDEYRDTAYLGQQDLIASLEWVKDNISQFGGDPDNVLIFGHSGGCRKVQALMHMPAAADLFHKAIGLSSIYNPISKVHARRVGEITVERLKAACPGFTLADLRDPGKVDYRTLLAAGTAALADTAKEFNLGRFTWNVVIDNINLHDDYADFAKPLPFMMGTVFGEMSNNNLPLIARNIFKNDWTEAETGRYLATRYGEDTPAIKAEFARLFPEMKIQDALFYDIDRRRAILNFLAEKARVGSAPVYNYLFTFEAPANGGVIPFHAAELIYIFYNVGLRELSRATGGTRDCYDMQDVMASSWVNFARTGNPNQTGQDNWKPFNPDTKTGTMIFNRQSRFAELDDEKLRKLIGDTNIDYSKIG